MTWLQKGGSRIIEPSKLQEVLNEQSIRLTSSTDDEAGFLRVGKMLGADGVVFADANITPPKATTFQLRTL